MEKAALRLELLKLTVPVSSHKGPNEVIAFANSLEYYVLNGLKENKFTPETSLKEQGSQEVPEKVDEGSENAISDKAEAPDDAGKEQGIDPAKEGKKVPKNKT